MARKIRPLPFLIWTATGLIFLYYLLHQRPEAFLSVFFRHMTPVAIGILMGMRLVYWLWRTINWKILMRGLIFPEPGLFDLFSCRLAAFSASTFSPGGKVLSEIMRIGYFREQSPKKVAATVVLDKMLELSASALSLMIGISCLLLSHSISGSIKILLLATPPFLIGAALWLVYIYKRQGLSRLSRRLLSLFGRQIWVEKAHVWLKEMSAHMSLLTQSAKIRLAGVFAIYCLMIAWWALELHLTLILLGGETPFATAYIVVTLGSLSMLLPTSPGNIGIYEGTYSALFLLLKIPADLGIAVIVSRRSLSLIWATFGLIPCVRFLRQGRKQA